MKYGSFLKNIFINSYPVRYCASVTILLHIFFIISMPVLSQTPFSVNIPGNAFSVKWQGAQGIVEDVAGGRKFRGNAATVLVLQTTLQMHPSSAAEHKIQRLIVHCRGEQYGATVRSVKLMNGTNVLLNITNAPLQADFTKAVNASNSWVWKQPVTVSPQSVLRFELDYPTGFEGPGSLVDFILYSVEINYAMKPLAGNSVTTANTSDLYTLSREDKPKPAEKRAAITEEDKSNYEALGIQAAEEDEMIAAFRNIQRPGPRLSGFDMGIGITAKNTAWGPGKQWFLDALSPEQQRGFKEAAALTLGKNNYPDLAANGMRINAADAQLSSLRELRKSGLFWLGFDIATGIFGNRALGALGNTAMGPGSEKIRKTAAEAEHLLLTSNDVETGFNASMAIHLSRTYK